MNKLASWPDLWIGMKVNMGKVQETGLAELYSIDRFKKIREMDFSGWDFNSEQLERILNEIPGSCLENINLKDYNLSEVSTELLANAISSLKNVNLSNTHLTANQSIKVLKSILNSKTLINMNLSFCNLRQVHVDLLANSVSHLQTVNLRGNNISTYHCVKVLEAIISSKTLININLMGCNLRQVPSELLAHAVSRLQKVNLEGAKLTTDQCVKMLEFSLSSKTLINMNLVGCNPFGFNQIPAELLASSVSRLQTVSLDSPWGSKLKTDHCVKLLEAILSSKTLINIKMLSFDFRLVPPELLANVVSRLQSITLCETHLTTDHYVKILEAIRSSKTLIIFDLRGACPFNLREVPSELLAKSVSCLQKVTLGSTDFCSNFLTTDQCIQLLETSLLSPTLVRVALVKVDIKGVPALLLDRIRLKYKLCTQKDMTGLEFCR